MKKTVLLFASAVIFVLMVIPSFAAQDPSIELGKTLFDDAGLGASQNAINCNTCHANGQGLENAAKNPKLADRINQCIIGPLKGQGISEDTVAMKSLIMYIKTFEK